MKITQRDDAYLMLRLTAHEWALLQAVFGAAGNEGVYAAMGPQFEERALRTMEKLKAARDEWNRNYTGPEDLLVSLESYDQPISLMLTVSDVAVLDQAMLGIGSGKLGPQEMRNRVSTFCADWRREVERYAAFLGARDE